MIKFYNYQDIFKEVNSPEDKIFIESPPVEKSKEITAYTFASARVNNGTALTIIDTPGLNDLSGSVNWWAVKLLFNNVVIFE